MMRNNNKTTTINNNNNNNDRSTLGTESIATAKYSLVNVPESADQEPTLTMQAAAQNGTVGFFFN
jgi:Mg-chelatase subunit ChlD